MLNKRREDLVQQLVKQLVSDYAPQRIVLFGSYAYGSPDTDSDIDLLVIKDTQESFFNRLARVRKVVSGIHRGIPFDPLVLTPDEIEARLQAGDQFIGEILEKGRIIYEA